MSSHNAKQEALLDNLLQDSSNPQDILGEHGLLQQLTKRLVERTLEAELTAHLGYAPHEREGNDEYVPWKKRRLSCVAQSLAQRTSASGAKRNNLRSYRETQLSASWYTR